MSFAIYRLMHSPTGIENCLSGFITHSSSVERPPNLVITAGNLLEVYIVRLRPDQQENRSASGGELIQGKPVHKRKNGGIMDGGGAFLELVCHYTLHGNVESMAVLPSTTGRSRDSIILTFRDCKVSVLYFDDSIHGLSTSSMHCFEGPEWYYLTRGKESFATGPLVKVDPKGRCGGVLVFDGLQLIILITADDKEDDGLNGTCLIGSGRAPAPRVHSSFIISLRQGAADLIDLKHVKDFAFVHGYNIEPVMVILHAIKERDDHTYCMISAFGISTTLKQPHPLNWPALHLPRDAYKLVAVPSPIGGVLVFCANSIHYRSDSASCARAVNSIDRSSNTTNQEIMQRSAFSVELDDANSTWLSNDVALLSTKTGELLFLTLIRDRSGVVQGLDLSKSNAASVLTSGITTVGNSLCFLGSRLGDSLLVQFTTHGEAGMQNEEILGGRGIEGEDSPSAKRSRMLSSDAVTQGAVSGDEDLHLYGLTAQNNNAQSAHKCSFSFTVKDSLINVGPLKDISYGLRTNADAHATGIAKQCNYEMVCSSGHGKNGALCVLRQSVRPNMITDAQLPGRCKGIWTVYHNNRALGHNADDDEYHAYLIISLEHSTMVLETADQLTEVTDFVDYFKQGRTISVGNLFGRRRVVQVYEHGARILDGSSRTQDISFGTSSNESGTGSAGSSVLSTCIVDPYVLLRMSDGGIRLLVGDPSLLTVSISNPAALESSKKLVSACTLYYDTMPAPWLQRRSSIHEVIDGAADDGQLQDQGGRVYCVVCYESGSLEIFDMPNFNCLFSVDTFVSGKTHLVDTSVLGHPPNYPKDVSGQMKVVELVMQRCPGEHSRPFLFGILNDGMILCYHAYLFDGLETEDSVSAQNNTDGSPNISASSSRRLRNLRFYRIPVGSYSRKEDASNGTTLCQTMTFFNNIAGYQGFFISGSRPAWFMVLRGRLRVHPQLCDGSIVAFSVLHNVNCKHGFVYVTSEGVLKICQLPYYSTYDNYWEVQKIPLKGTPHQVTYLSEKNLYAVIVSTPIRKPLRQVVPSLVDGLDQTYSADQFEVRLVEPEKSGGAWKTNATIPMQTCENALTIRVVKLFNTTTLENETLLAIGTAVAGGGRVILFSTGKDVGSDTQNLVSEVYSKEFKDAISAFASVEGHLLIASGRELILHDWDGTKMEVVALLDVLPSYAVSLNVVKNFILVGDIHKHIYFLSWTQQSAQLSLLGKASGELGCLSTEFLIDGSTLNFIVADVEKNVQMFNWAKGKKLLSRGEFHVGAHVSKLLRLPMLSSAAASSDHKANMRFALLFGTLDGSVGCIAPIDEVAFRRLQSLQTKLVACVPHVAGLNPRSFRQFRAKAKAHLSGPADNIIDFELLRCYEMLRMEEQLEIAQQIGSTRARILSSIDDFCRETSFM